LLGLAYFLRENGGLVVARDQDPILGVDLKEEEEDLEGENE
jgi:hypothetical protein